MGRAFILTHIQARYHFFKDKVHVEKEIEVEKIPLRKTGADMLTKLALVGVVRYNKKLLGIHWFFFDYSAQFCFRGDGTSICEDKGNGSRPAYKECGSTSVGGSEGVDEQD